MVRDLDTYQGDNKTSTDVAEEEGTIVMALSKSLKEVRHFEEPADLTGIITEDETSHRDEEAHPEGRPCHPAERRVVQVRQ